MPSRPYAVINLEAVPWEPTEVVRCLFVALWDRFSTIMLLKYNKVSAAR
jgi:hypothetical protein